MQTPNRWITAKALASRMPAWLKQTGWISRLSELLEHLTHKEWLVAGGGRYYADEKLEQAFESGLIHSNIESRNNEVEVVDQDTRRVLGTLPRTATGDGSLLLGGRRLRVSRKMSGSRVLVTDTTAKADLKVTSVRGPVIHANLARDLARFLGLEPNAAHILQLEDSSFAFFHFLGNLWGTLLGILLTMRTGRKPIGANAFCLQLADSPEVFPSDMSTEEIRSAAMRHRFKLRGSILEGKWVRYLPSDWRRTHLTNCLDIEGFRETLKRMDIKRTTESPQLYNALVHLAPPDNSNK